MGDVAFSDSADEESASTSDRAETSQEQTGHRQSGALQPPTVIHSDLPPIGNANPNAPPAASLPAIGSQSQGPSDQQPQPGGGPDKIDISSYRLNRNEPSDATKAYQAYTKDAPTGAPLDPAVFAQQDGNFQKLPEDLVPGAPLPSAAYGPTSQLDADPDVLAPPELDPSMDPDGLLLAKQMPGLPTAPNANLPDAALAPGGGNPLMSSGPFGGPASTKADNVRDLAFSKTDLKTAPSDDSVPDLWLLPTPPAPGDSPIAKVLPSADPTPSVRQADKWALPGSNATEPQTLSEPSWVQSAETKGALDDPLSSLSPSGLPVTPPSSAVAESAELQGSHATPLLPLSSMCPNAKTAPHQEALADCTWYSSKTCCSLDESVQIRDFFKTSYLYSVSQQCGEHIRVDLCSKCSPDASTFSGLTVRSKQVGMKVEMVVEPELVYCQDWCFKVFEACKADKFDGNFLPATNGQPLGDLVPNGLAFCQARNIRVSETGGFCGLKG
eukprot:gnl/Hemi2/21878_TR7304_c0_g1_i1.p1 gnl/Hemi2/21878_TR7304_c0_g1~~gnl/Hemi2/21878_TR7304_c0_g1_i1.p1  ORF type:complete len:498 (-),score=132.57 gnl/Hemi2/21878_TR7304_c0_g1_i1:124-1617(-)